jgi:predicted secreted protein
VPEFSLFGDGRIITAGAADAKYPGAAVPALTVHTVTDAAVTRLLDAAKAAGLLGPDRAITGGGPADIGTTVFTLNADGTHQTSVVGLAGTPPAGASAADTAARKALAGFAAAAQALVAGPSTAYQPSALRLLATPYAAPDASTTVRDWPITGTTPASLGTSVSSGVCGAVSGADAAAFLAAAKDANTSTAWTAGGVAWSIAVRPLLPDESGCQTADPAGAALSADCSQSSVTLDAAVAPGGTLLVALCSNASTGYTWGAPKITGKAVSLSDSAALPPPVSRPGAAGAQVFTFTANAAGTAVIDIAYARPSDAAHPGSVIKIRVTVAG